MRLPQQDMELFYKLHPALLQYVNQRLGLLPEIKEAEQLRMSGLENVALVRDALWENPRLIDKFVAENPYDFSKEELNIVASWRYALQENFYLLRHLKKHSIFLMDTEPPKAYGVCSLLTSLDQMFPNLPVYLKAVLIPFRDYIIYDGALFASSMTFGSGFCFDLNETYRDAKRRFGVIMTLEDRH